MFRGGTESQPEGAANDKSREKYQVHIDWSLFDSHISQQDSAYASLIYLKHTFVYCGLWDGLRYNLYKNTSFTVSRF